MLAQVLGERIADEGGVGLELKYHLARHARRHEEVREAKVRHQLKPGVVHHDVHAPPAARLRLHADRQQVLLVV